MKPVLIIENSSNGLKLNENASSTKTNKYLMEGTFTEFNIRNRNDRVYTADEFVPHVQRMMEKKEWGAVYGEYDHPDVFDVSMKYVSHTIENAYYNEAKNTVDGEIRLLSTHWGKEAKSLVDDGCPLFVSSRAAGITEGNGYVKIKQLFTYDIVADPGFSSAKMNIKTLNESLGFNVENTGIIEADKQKLALLNEKYEKSSDRKLFDLSDDIKTNQLFEMNKNDQITKAQLNDYSKYITSEIKKVENFLITKISESKNKGELKNDIEKLTSYYDSLQENFSKIVGYLDYLAEQVQVSVNISESVKKKQDDIVEYTNYLAENLDKNIDYSNYLAENLDKNIDYSNYLAENLDKNIEYSDYLAENLDKNIDYSNYLAENLDKNIDYSNYLAENLDKNIEYSDYLAENLDTSIAYSDYLTENIETLIDYSEYIAETLDKSIDYSDYISECVDKTMDYSNMIAEKLNNSKKLGFVNESFESADEYLKSIKEEEIEEEEEDHTSNDDNDDNDSEDVEETTINKENKKDFENFINDGTSNESTSSKIDKLIEEAKKREASKDQTPAFYAFLNPNDIKAFENLTQNEQETVKVAIKESVVGFYSRQDVLKIMKSVLESEKLTPEQIALNGMPEEIVPVWEKLDTKTKKSILSQSVFYDMSTNEMIQHFWTTRKFDKQLLNENKKTLIDYRNPFSNDDKMENDEIEAFEKRFKNLR